MKKNGNTTSQFLPYLKINDEMIPPVEMHESFYYLGKRFSFKMGVETIKKDIIERFNCYIEKLNMLQMHPKNKLLVISKFVYSKIRWEFSIYNFGVTWVTQNLDSIIKEYVKRWLHLPQSANFGHLYLPVKQLGLKFSLPSDIFKNSQLTTRNILKNSKSKDIAEIHKSTQYKHIAEEFLLMKAHTKKPRDGLKNETIEQISRSLGQLKEQNIILKMIQQHCLSSSIVEWQRVVDKLPENLFVFIRKALIFCLPNNSNLARWKKSVDSACGLCKTNTQTQLHILNNCQSSVISGRYTWRHNSVLTTLCNYLTQLPEFTLFADIPGYQNPSIFFKRYRPDIVIINCRKMIILELTICFETNLEKSRNYKKEKYHDLEDDCIDERWDIEKVFIEVSSLGFVTKNIKELKSIIKDHNTYKRLVNKMTETAIRASFYIYTKRNKLWDEPSLLNFI